MILFEKFRQLLQAASMGPTGDLREIYRTDVLISQIEGFEFVTALEALIGLGGVDTRTILRLFGDRQTTSRQHHLIKSLEGMLQYEPNPDC